MSLNVNRAITDQFYRYKMPRLLAKVEGSGNGIKTVIINMVEIAKSLCRPPTYPTKFFGCELGAQTQFDFKNNRFIVNGSHDANKLQDLLDVFIRKYVLCPECDNPETLLIVKKGAIGQRCIACGHVGMVDLRHKLSTFIIKNPPEHDPKALGSSKTERKQKKSEKKQQNGEGDACQDEFGQDGNGGDDDVEWSVDTSEDAVAQRMQSLSSGAKGLTLNDDLEKTGQERLDIFYKFVKGKKAEGMPKGVDKEFANEAERLEVKDKAPLIMAELLLNEKIFEQLKMYRPHFMRVTNENQKAQKYLIGGIEQLIALHAKTLMPKASHIFKILYDLDLVEEEVLLAWAAKPSKKYVSKEVMQQIHEKVAPFIKWLKEAEEEESSEDEEVQVDFSHRGGGGLKVETVNDPNKNNKPAAAPPKQEPEDEIDIDDI